MAKTQKFSVIIDSNGAIVGAFSAVAEKQGADAVQSGIDAAPGQSLHDIDAPEEFSKLDGPDLLQQLSRNDKVQEILSSIPSSGFVPMQGAAPETLALFSATGAPPPVADGQGVVAGQLA